MTGGVHGGDMPFHIGQDPEDLPEDGEPYWTIRPWSYWAEEQAREFAFVDLAGEGSE